MTGELRQTDAEVALFLTECWLQWFFCDSLFGERLPALTSEGAPLHRMCLC